ncbi:putative barnase/colicin E5 family endoribonuclease, partial [Helicobacter vulpis]
KAALTNPDFVLHPNKKPDLLFIKQEGDHFFFVEPHKYNTEAFGYGRLNPYEFEEFRKSGKYTQPLEGYQMPPKPSKPSRAKEKSAPKEEPPQSRQNIEANPAFGENFKEFALKGKEAVSKLLKERRGQVSGAFYKEGLGYIDLVWGEFELKAAPGAKKPKSYGLSKILEKHASDFESFKGADIGEKLANGLEYLIKNGEAKDENNVKTIIGKHNGETFRVGLSKGWNHKGDNYWVITTYKLDKSPGSDVLPSNQIAKSDGTNLHSNDSTNNTTSPLKAQEQDEIALEPAQIEEKIQMPSAKAITEASATINYAPSSIEKKRAELENLLEERERVREGGMEAIRKIYPNANEDTLEIALNRLSEDIARYRELIKSNEHNLEKAQTLLKEKAARASFKQNLGPIGKAKVAFAKATKKGYIYGERNKYLTNLLVKWAQDKGHLKDVEKSKMGISPNFNTFNHPLLRNELDKAQRVLTKLEKLEPKSITPAMRAEIARMERSAQEQEKDLAAFKKAYETFLRNWEKVHQQSADIAWPVYSKKDGFVHQKPNPNNPMERE